MSGASDNCERVMGDLKTALDQMPPPAFYDLISKWQMRETTIRRQLAFVNAPGGPPCPATREADTLKQVIRELKAACAVEQGDALRAFRILVEEDD